VLAKLLMKPPLRINSPPILHEMWNSEKPVHATRRKLVKDGAYACWGKRRKSHEIGRTRIGIMTRNTSEYLNRLNANAQEFWRGKLGFNCVAPLDGLPVFLERWAVFGGLGVH
jgi:hypothetical protein